MKKLLIVCGLLFSVITFAKAQGQQQTPEERAKNNTTRLAEKLNLTDDQKTKVEAIFLDQAKASVKLREEAAGDRDAMRTKMQKLNEETNTKISALLTDDQKKAFEAWKTEQQENMRRRQGGGGGGPRAGGN